METKKPQLPILLMLMAFGSVCATLYTPALPAIQLFFGVSVGDAQTTITTYLLGYALGQLPYGPLANRYGRKKTLYIGVGLAIFGSVLCALSEPIHSFGLLIFARFVQALGASVGLKISFTMIADVYEQSKLTKIISRLLMAFAIMPGIASAVGGWLTQLLNWTSCFYFLALFGVFLLWLCTRLPETAKSLDSHALRLSSVFTAYGEKFKNPHIVISALMMGSGTAILYIFAAKAPFIGINLIGLKPSSFGSLNLFPPMGILIGSILSERIAGKFHVLNIILGGILGSLAITLSMLIPFFAEIITPWSLFAPMFFIYLSESFVYANTSSYGLTTAKNKSNASAVMNFINIGMAFVAVLLAELIYPESALLLPIAIALFFLFMLALWFKIRKIDIS